MFEHSMYCSLLQTSSGVTSYFLKIFLRTPYNYILIDELRHTFEYADLFLHCVSLQNVFKIQALQVV